MPTSGPTARRKRAEERLEVADHLGRHRLVGGAGPAAEPREVHPRRIARVDDVGLERPVAAADHLLAEPVDVVHRAERRARRSPRRSSPARSRSGTSRRAGGARSGPPKSSDDRHAERLGLDVPQRELDARRSPWRRCRRGSGAPCGRGPSRSARRAADPGRAGPARSPAPRRRRRRGSGRPSTRRSRSGRRRCGRRRTATGRQPASTTNVSIPVIFIAVRPGRRTACPARAPRPADSSSACRRSTAPGGRRRPAGCR